MKTYLRFFTLFALCCVVGACGYMLFMYHSVKETLNTIYEPIQPASAAAAPAREPSMPATVAQSVLGGNPLVSSKAAEPGEAGPSEQSLPSVTRGEAFTLLFLGVDERQNDRGRSDSIIVLGVNPGKHSVLMFNIPRDTRTEIVGRGTQDKINHAYAFGGVTMAVDTVERFLNIPIDYYVKVNMEGFEKVIDILGGVQVNNPFAFRYEGITYPEGMITLAGHEALMYSRMRYDDPRGDIGRNARQQSIIADLLGRAKSISTVRKLDDILQQVQQNTKTNLTMDDMLSLSGKYREQTFHIAKDEVAGSGQMINSIYYYMVSAQEKERIRAKLLEQLQE